MGAPKKLSEKWREMKRRARVKRKKTGMGEIECDGAGAGGRKDALRNWRESAVGHVSPTADSRQFPVPQSSTAIDKVEYWYRIKSRFRPVQLPDPVCDLRQSVSCLPPAPFRDFKSMAYPSKAGEVRNVLLTSSKNTRANAAKKRQTHFFPGMHG